MNRSETAGSEERVIVVGSGPCGAIAAAQLVERGVPVTLLDAGLGAPRGLVVKAAGNTIFRRMDRRQLETDRHDRTASEGGDWHSSRSHGGLSNYWTSAVPRFAPEDFTEGAALDERYVWPLTYDELIPFYERAERLLRVTAGTPFANVPANMARFHVESPSDWADLANGAARHGHSLGPIPMAKGSPWMVARRGTEFNSYGCIIEPLLSAAGFDLVAGANVTKLNWNPTSGRVDSVDSVHRTTGARTTWRCRAVVVAAGAIDTTTLLLRSVSQDFPTGLGNSAGLIGRYLHDHPREWWTATPSRPLTALAHPVYLTRGKYDPDHPLMATAMTIGLATRTERLRTYVRSKSRSFGVQVFGTMIPQPEIGVAIPAGLAENTVDFRPTISLRYDQATVDNLISSRQRLIDVFADVGMRVAVPGPFHDLTPGSSVHHGGSVRMHSSTQFGALDGSNRLHDVPNVVVCDSSCFTTGPEKNPTLTAMAIAARAADHLASEYLGECPATST